LTSSNQKVQSQASASFVIVCKNWRVPNTSDGSWTNRDELQVSLIFIHKNRRA